MKDISDSLCERIYRSLKKIRIVEEKIAEIYPTDVIKSPIHLSIGQEAVSVGVCEAMDSSDIAFGTYRGHALYLAKDGDLRKMLAELYGKSNGCGKGKAGSMHLVDIDKGVMGTSAIVASTIPNAVGYAYAAKMKNKNIAVVSFFGDGAVEEGVFYESLNFASLKKLPILFICENNQYAIHSPLKDRQPDDNIIGRVRSFGVRAERIEGNDVLEIYKMAREMLEGIKSNEIGPCFLECMTYRWLEHVGPNEDFELGYRSEGEAKVWIDNDQLVLIGDRLDIDVKNDIDLTIKNELKEALDFAQAGEFPGREELYTDVYTKTK